MPLKGTPLQPRVLLLPHTFRQDELLYSVLLFQLRRLIVRGAALLFIIKHLKDF